MNKEMHFDLISSVSDIVFIGRSQKKNWLVYFMANVATQSAGAEYFFPHSRTRMH